MAVSGGEGDRAMPGSGEGHRVLLRSLDYPCTARLRLRRLHAYHRWYTHWAVYDAMKEKTTVFFHVKDMMNLIKVGNWRKAASYLQRFLPLHNPHPISDEASLLELFLKYLMTLDDFADGKTFVTCLISDWFLSICTHPVLTKYPCFATFVDDVLFLRSDHAKAFVNWQLVRNKAAAIAEEMVRKTPELMGRLHSPRGPKDLFHVVPIGSGFHRRRHVRMACRQQPTDLARFYLQMKRRMPSLNQRTGLDDSGTSGEPLMVLLDKALQAGRRPEVKQVDYPEYLSRGFPLVQMLSRTLFFRRFNQVPLPEHLQKQGTSQNPAEHAVFSSEPNHTN